MRYEKTRQLGAARKWTTILAARDQAADWNSDRVVYMEKVGTAMTILIMIELFVMIPVVWEVLKYLRPLTTYGRAERVLTRKLSTVIKQREKDRSAGIVRFDHTFSPVYAFVRMPSAEIHAADVYGVYEINTHSVSQITRRYRPHAGRE